MCHLMVHAFCVIRNHHCTSKSQRFFFLFFFLEVFLFRAMFNVCVQYEEVKVCLFVFPI